MCKAPNLLEDGTLVACRKCSLCRDRAINDWVGRCVAESKTADYCLAGTLTYGRNSANDEIHERAVVLTYSDFQKFVKLLRRHGYDVRYLVAGEYGSKKGRAHWHPVLYFTGKVPDWDLDKRIEIPEWPHGLTHWTKPNYPALRYNVKYVQKAMGGDQKQGHLAMSKKPPLGSRFFEQLAERYVQQGLAPQDLFYSFPEVKRRKRNGWMEIIPFMLKGRSAELFLAHYIEQWQARHGKKPWPNSQLVDLFSEWGRVINDEDRATAAATEHITTRKLVADYWKPHREETPWEPLRLLSESWGAYFERWPSGEARQRQEALDEFQYYSEWLVAYDQCVKAGAEPSDLQREFRTDIGIAIANIVCGAKPGHDPEAEQRADAVSDLGLIAGWQYYFDDFGFDEATDQPRKPAAKT